jgi:hypothetical protein
MFKHCSGLFGLFALHAEREQNRRPRCFKTKRPPVFQVQNCRLSKIY